MKTFEETWTKETVQTILNEYQSNGNTYLCHASPTFKDIWCSIHRANIRQLVFAWSPEEKAADTPDHTECMMYIESINNMRQARLEFLNHELARLS